MRTASVERKTGETKINGKGESNISSPLKFLNHMLESFSKHSGFDLRVDAEGDVEVEDHHLVEDLGICIGEALDKALGDKYGIERIAHSLVPMDDSIATVAVDLSGRPYSLVNIKFSEFKDAKLGDVSKENIPHFFESLALNGKLNLYIRVEGVNDHHRVEACFKALGRALRDASRISGEDIPSTKGVI
ncbi:MAG: imidazoleglycerol-phosphate dehydratase [Candidatus Altiarchaeales archaeon ex4484_2]|nr:MAG: imidazoleglycerol-phosphate dehydratase [Candidatus Altiarchaeales archaeon ex4484_2]